MSYIAFDLAKANNLTDTQADKLLKLETTTSRLRDLIADIQRNLNFTLEYLNAGNRPYSYPVSAQDTMSAAVLQEQMLMAADTCLEAGIPAEIVTQVTKNDN